MRAYVQDTARRWMQFPASHPLVAGELRELVLSVCGDMSNVSRKKQVEAMTASDQFKKLSKIALQHKELLGIRDDTERELALWVRTICFCSVLATSKDAR